MAFFTVISIVIALFGASQAIISAVRSHSEATLKALLEESKSRCNEFTNRCKTDSSSQEIKDKALKWRDQTEKSFSRWRMALFAPTIIFSSMTVILFLFLMFVPWVDTNGQVLVIPQHCITWTKWLLGIYFCLLAGFAASLYCNGKNMRNLHERIKDLSLGQMSGISRVKHNTQPTE